MRLGHNDQYDHRTNDMRSISHWRLKTAVRNIPSYSVLQQVKRHWKYLRTLRTPHGKIAVELSAIEH